MNGAEAGSRSRFKKSVKCDVAKWFSKSSNKNFLKQTEQACVDFAAFFGVSDVDVAVDVDVAADVDVVKGG